MNANPILNIRILQIYLGVIGLALVLTGKVFLPTVHNVANLQGSTNWPMAGANPARTSWTPDEAPGRLHALWVHPIESYVPLHAQVIGANGSIYVSTANGLVAFDSETGAEKWVFPTELPLGHSPTYSEGVLYIPGLDRNLYAVRDDGASFSLLWTYTALAGFETNPLVVEGKVIAGNRDGFLYALNKDTGREAWVFDTKQGSEPRAQIRYSAAYANGKIYFGAMNGNAYGVDIDGKYLWHKKLPGMGWFAWWPVIYENKVVFFRTEESRNSDRDFSGGADQAYERDHIIGDGSSGMPVGPIGAEAGNWVDGTPTTNVTTNVRGLTTIPDYFEQNKHARNVFILDQNTGAEVQYDIDGDGIIDAAPILRPTQDYQTSYPPMLSGYDDVLYFRSPLLESGAYAGSMAWGWKVGTPHLSLPISSMPGESPDWPADEFTAFSGGGKYMYWHLILDRHIGSADLSQPNTSFPDYSPSRQFRFDKSLPPNYDREMAKFAWQWGATEQKVPVGHQGGAAPIIYDGKMYAILSNALVAFSPDGAGTQAPILPVSPIEAPRFGGTSLDTAALVSSLEEELGKIIAAGHLKPGYGVTGHFDSPSQGSLGDSLLDYWHDSGDVHYVLLRALPFLNPPLQGDVRAYLQSEFSAFSPAQYAHIGWKDGRFRESFDFPPGMIVNIAAMPAQATPVENFEGWSLPPHNIYAVWKYAQAGLGNPNALFTQVQVKLRAPITANRPILTDDYLSSMPHIHNAYIAGYTGYVELAKLAGRPLSEYSAYQAELNRLMQLRSSQFTINLVHWSGLTPNAIRDYFLMIHAWNFMYMVPELSDYLADNNLSQVREALDHYTFQAPYWMIAHNRESQGENGIVPYQHAHSLFQARAKILGETQASLTKYLDSPIVPVGDLYYIDNIVSALEADGLKTDVVESSSTRSPRLHRRR